MKAMILAAGFGTRLLPMTKNRPKALVEINGKSLLELVIRRLYYFGFTELVINVHHHADQIIDFLHRHHHFGCDIRLSVEHKILGTGGGLQHAADFLMDGEPFLLHNVDILTDFNYTAMITRHLADNSIATLGVMNRNSNRYLLIDDNHNVCGHENSDTHVVRIIQKTGSALKRAAFSGIHVISPSIFKYMNKPGFYSIIDLYLELLQQGEQIGGFEMDDCFWKDIGRKEQLDEIVSLLNDTNLRKRLFPFF
ncbi:nucleotidyltransferase family protein [candidate division KSB1 bacterium]|nr:nucleotidyltransferase family protein [candidate division KSB1 bacterium]